MIKIGIDCRPLTIRPTGISKYLADAINAIQSYSDNIEMYLFAPKPFDINTINLYGDRVHIIICPLSFLNKYVLWYNIEFVKQCKKYNVDYIWTGRPDIPLFLPHKFKTIVTVHDVVSIEFSKTRKHDYLRLYRNIMEKKSIKKADYIWCNSKYTSNKVEYYYPTRRCKDLFVGFSCSTAFKKCSLPKEDILNIKKKYSIEDKFILFVGTLEPRKNLTFLLDVMERIHSIRPTLKLVIVGGRGWENTDIFNKVNKPGYPIDSVIFTDYIDTETLIKLYNIADCYVSTSINEGFGLPQLEAMKCGCPVVTSHNSAMIEVVEGRGITVKGFDIDIWVKKIFDGIDTDKQKLNYDLSDFNWENIVNKFVTYITKTI